MVCTATRKANTIPKSPGKTVDNAVIDLRKFETTAGLTFGCLNHAKRPRDLLVEPMSFERLSKLGKKPTLKIRLEKGVQLNTVAVETILRHGVRVP